MHGWHGLLNIYNLTSPKGLTATAAMLAVRPCKEDSWLQRLMPAGQVTWHTTKYHPGRLHSNLKMRWRSLSSATNLRPNRPSKTDSSKANCASKRLRIHTHPARLSCKSLLRKERISSAISQINPPFEGMEVDPVQPMEQHNRYLKVAVQRLSDRSHRSAPEHAVTGCTCVEHTKPPANLMASGGEA